MEKEATFQVKAHGKGQGRIFKSALLERLTKTSPIIMICTYLSLVTLVLIGGYFRLHLHPGKAIAIFIAGVFTWTFLEYLIHRYVFHFVNEWKWTERFHYIVHGVHHEYPRDGERLFMPPVPGLIAAFIFFSFFWLLLGNYAFYFMPGVVLGYMIYSFTHWSIHTFQPPRALQFLWRHHNMHHYRTPDKAFGVSSVFWDYVFGTLPPKK